MASHTSELWVIHVKTDSCDEAFFICENKPRSRKEVYAWLEREQPTSIIEFSDEDWRDYTYVEWFPVDMVTI